MIEGREHVVFLYLSEIEELSDRSDNRNMTALVARRKDDLESWKTADPPTTIGGAAAR